MVLTSGTWLWRVGQTNVLLLDPEGRRLAVDLADLINGAGLRGPTNWHLIERGRWKKTFDGTVFPREVRAYIEQHA